MQPKQELLLPFLVNFPSKTIWINSTLSNLDFNSISPNIIKLLYLFIAYYFNKAFENAALAWCYKILQFCSRRYTTFFVRIQFIRTLKNGNTCSYFKNYKCNTTVCYEGAGNLLLKASGKENGKASKKN